jgi:hypothetical protein
MNWTDREKVLLSILVSLGLAAIIVLTIYSRWRT